MLNTTNSGGFFTIMADNPFEIPSFTTPFDYSSQWGQGNEFIKDYSSFLGSQDTVPQIVSRYENQLMIPQLREQVQQYSETADDISSMLRGIPESVAGRTRESMVTESQAARMRQKESEPLLQNLSTISSAGEKAAGRLSQAQSLLGTYTQAELAQQQKMLQPWEKQYDFMNVMQAREMTGWTTQNQLELNRLITNARTGLAWTDAEKERAHQLSMQENTYKNELDKMEKQADLSYLYLWA